MLNSIKKDGEWMVGPSMNFERMAFLCIFAL